MSLSFFEETQLPNGPLVISHAMPEAQSVAIGIFVDVGSRDETPGQAGITHALEHMLFKGTKALDVHALAARLDELGGNANAFTSRERTCFHLHVLHEHWREALSLLSSMLLEPALPEDEWLREREVIYSEMAMVEDIPEEWVMDQHVAALFPDQQIGGSVLGTHEALARFGRDDLQAYMQRWYRSPRLLITAAGRIDHQELAQESSKYPWLCGQHVHDRQQAIFQGGVQPLVRDAEQVQLVVSMPGIHAASAERPVAWMANQVLGGGMSSRLFSEIREKRGLAYGIGSHLSTLTDIGTWTVTCGTNVEHASDCVDVLGRVLDEFISSINLDEVERGKRQMEVHFRMAMDSVEAQMLGLGARLDEKELMTPLQWIEQLNQVTLASVKDWTADKLARPRLWSIGAPEQALSGICDRIRPC